MTALEARIFQIHNNNYCGRLHDIAAWSAMTLHDVCISYFRIDLVQELIFQVAGQ